MHVFDFCLIFKITQQVEHLSYTLFALSWFSSVYHKKNKEFIIPSCRLAQISCKSMEPISIIRNYKSIFLIWLYTCIYRYWSMFLHFLILFAQMIKQINKITCTGTFQSTCTCKKKITDCSWLIKQKCFKVPINFFLLKCFLSSVKFYVTRL